MEAGLIDNLLDIDFIIDLIDAKEPKPKKRGDIVLDPFCGCATTCIASEKLERKWVGIDISSDAIKIANERLKV